jgi:hypothetical protein
MSGVDHGGGVDLFCLNIGEKAIYCDVHASIWYF